MYKNMCRQLKGGGMEIIMDDNFFTFCGGGRVEYDFFEWCLKWYNNKSEPKSELFFMAKELLALMGEDKLSDDQEIDISDLGARYSFFVNLRGLNRVLAISFMIGSEEREDEIAAYRERILRHRKAFGVNGLVEVRTVLFQTGLCDDCYQDIASDSKINKELLLGVMEKYRNVNRSLDLYIESLEERISVEIENGQYKKLIPLENSQDWNISRQHIAQYNFMRDMFREHYPQSMWKYRTDSYKIQQGDDSVDGHPWTEFYFNEGTYPGGKIEYYLCWHLEYDENGIYISLRLFESSGREGIDYGRMDEVLKQMAEGFLIQHPQLGLSWSEVQNNFTEIDGFEDIMGHRVSTILSICLNKALENWTEEAERIKQGLLHITDYFIA